jgi:hypothetical protein
MEGPATDQSGPLQNSVTLRDVSGGGAQNYPVRIGRPFIEGEIKNAPQAVLHGNKLLTQTDVKTRWPDGSVQHAIMSFIVPRLPSNGTVVISFANQPAVESAALSVTEMLHPSFDFDSVMLIAQGDMRRRVSAREMLAAGQFTVWCKGPIATTVVLADHSAARKYDMGFDELRSVRPIFHATFWPALRKVHVRAIGENANTETLEDVEYSLALRGGLTKPQEVYRQDAVTHYAATRWTRTFWIGGAPDPIDLDHNLRYLAATRTFPNFDTSLRVPDNVIGRTYAIWERQPKALYDAGGWTKYMPTTGGRDDIGPYTASVTKWLYTGDHRLFEIVTTMADLAGAWPLHVREGNPAKQFDLQKKIPSMGRVLSIYARPSLTLFFPEGHPATPQDVVRVQGVRLRTGPRARVNDGWVSDGAHQPDPYSAIYALTGDAFALEQMQFWAAYQAASYDSKFKRIAPSGVIMDQVRGCAWVLRNRVHAAFLSPDGTPEKRYFSQMIDDPVAHWEGRFGIHGTKFQDTPLWQFGQQAQFVSPLRFFAEHTPRADEGLRREYASTATQLWEHYMLLFELGRAKEKGFATEALLSWLAPVLTGHFTAGDDYDPYNFQRYDTAVRDGQQKLYQTWPATLVAYSAPLRKFFNTDIGDGYGSYGYAAATMITREPGGMKTYNWIRDKGYKHLRIAYSGNPKWAFIPRDREIVQQ